MKITQKLRLLTVGNAKRLTKGTGVIGQEIDLLPGFDAIS